MVTFSSSLPHTVQSTEQYPQNVCMCLLLSQTAGASCHPHQTTSYRATLREVSQEETLAVLWHSQGNRDSSTARNSGNAWTYKGDIPRGQEELVWLVNFTSLTNSSRTKLRVTATFVNTFGEATHTDEFEFGKSSDSSTVLLYS